MCRERRGRITMRKVTGGFDLTTALLKDQSLPSRQSHLKQSDGGGGLVSIELIDYSCRWDCSREPTGSIQTPGPPWPML